MSMSSSSSSSSLHNNTNIDGDYIIDDCEVCGWIAAIGAMVAFGTFGVPIKSKIATTLQIDPLIM